MDFIHIHVGYAIAPADSDVTLGDVTCLHSALVTSIGDAGSWHAAQPEVVQLDARGGVALATQVGATTVSYNLTANSATYTHVSRRALMQLT